MSDKQPAPEPGIYHGVSFQEYCQWNAVNNSSLGPALKSGQHYVHAQANPRADTPAFAFGRLAHEGRLEPAAVLDRFVVMPDLTAGITVNGKPAAKPKATAEYKQRVQDWHTENEGKHIIEHDEWERTKGVLNALWNNQRAREWFTSPGQAEVSIVWIDATTGLRCKARIDKVVHNQLLADMKTSRDADRFETSIVDYGYDRQAAFYLDGWHAVTGHRAQFAFAAVESEAPHGVRAAPAGPAVIVAGRRKYQEALRVVAAVRAQDGHPDGYAQPDEFDVPPWQRRAPFVLNAGNQQVEVYA